MQDAFDADAVWLAQRLISAEMLVRGAGAVQRAGAAGRSLGHYPCR